MIDKYHNCHWETLFSLFFPLQLFLSIFPNVSIEKIASPFLLLPFFLPLFVSIHLYRGGYNSGLRISLALLQGLWWILSQVFEQWRGEERFIEDGGEKNLSPRNLVQFKSLLLNCGNYLIAAARINWMLYREGIPKESFRCLTLSHRRWFTARIRFKIKFSHALIHYHKDSKFMG